MISPDTQLVKTEPADPPDPVDQDRSSRPEPKRINVAVTPDMVSAIEFVMEREGISLTEAVRRLIGYGDYVYRAVKQDGANVLVKVNDNIREVVLL